MIIVIGEVLIDLFEDYERIGGAPFNFAFHLKQMGFPVRLITRVGDDRHGRRILDMLAAHGFDREDVQIDRVHPTGLVNVSVNDRGVPAFDILKDVAYDYLQLDDVTEAAGKTARMLYLGTLAQRTQGGYEQFRRFLENQAAGKKVFLDINLRPPHINPDAVAASLNRADIVKLNDDELIAIQRQFNRPEAGDVLARWLLRRCSIEWLILTQGDAGSRIFTEEQLAVIPTPKAEKMVDTVGAGDAYASVIAAGYLLGVPITQIGHTAAAFASQICAEAGAIPGSNDMYPTLRQQIEGAVDAQ